MEMTCQACGMRCDGRYHPHAFCVLYKAGIDPEAFVRDAADKVGRNVAEISYSEPLPQPPE